MGMAILAVIVTLAIILGVFGEYRFGTVCLRRYLCTASQAIEIGTMVYQDSSTKKLLPAASFTWNTNLATTQTDFHKVFAGVMQERRRADQNDNNPADVAETGVFEFSCAALGSALDRGAYIGPDKQSGNFLENFKVISVASASLAIGKLAAPAASGATKLLVEIVSTVGKDGTQSIA